MSGPKDARRWVLYGACGFTGRLILARALELGLRPVVAGRTATANAELAGAHGLEHLTARVDDAGALVKMLGEAKLVLNAAGPFGKTAGPLMESCLKTGTCYVDIGGDVSVLRQQLEFAEAFTRAGIAAVLAVGFDVVPTDYAAKWVASGGGEPPTGGDEIRLGLSLPLSMSRGSAKAMIDEIAQGTLVLKGGVLEPVGLSERYSVFDYGRGPRMSLASTWGDLLTAPLTTGIGNVSVYFEATPEVRRAARVSRWLAGPARWEWFRTVLRTLVRLQAEGPAEELRRAQHATIVAHLLRGGKVVRRVRVRTGDPYEFTGAAAAKAVQRLLEAEDLVGIRTPASVLGDDFLVGIPGVSIEAPVGVLA